MSITLSALQKQRRDTAANWTAEDPTLLAGEIGLESDTGYWKVGDGSTAWTSLAYVSGLGAEISVDRLADGAARQLLQTDAAGTGVEWTDDVDVPGTLDVTGVATFDDDVTIQGDLTVNGTTTTIDTTTLVVEDKNIEIGKVATPTDVTADGGGITLKGDTDKTINWIDATDAWTFSEHVDLASAKEYRIAGTKVLDATSLGSAVVSSSLTSVGTISTGVWNGTTVATGYGGTGQTTYTDGELLIGKTDGTLAKATIIQGSGVTITNGDGTITIAATGSGGTVTSVDVTGGTGLTSSGGPITSSGAITVDLDDTAVTPGSYTYASITVDQQGRLTAASNGTAPLTSSDIGVTVQGYDADTAKLDATQTFTAAQTFAADLTLNAQSDLRFADSDSSNWVAFQAPATVASNVTWTLPDADGSSGDVLSTDGAGVLSWTTVGGGGATDKIEEGNTSAEVIDTGSDGRFVVTTEGTERARIDSSGRLLVGTSTALSNVQWFGTTYIAPTRQTAGSGHTAEGIFAYAASTAAGAFYFNKSRGATIGSNAIVAQNDAIGDVVFSGNDGTNFIRAASIRADVDGTPGTNDMPGRLIFNTTADGASSPTERMRIGQNALTSINGVYIHTTGNAANVHVDSSAYLLRSTSSIKYKTDVEDAEGQYSEALLQCRPVWYRSTCQRDNPAHSYWGFIAEEVAEIDPRLVHWKTTEPVVQENGSIENVPCDPEPEGVAYERFVPHLLNLIKRQNERIETLEAKVAALEGN